LTVSHWFGNLAAPALDRSTPASSNGRWFSARAPWVQRCRKGFASD